ncbi:hypothetical protein HanPI659440_Chr13g0507671 [Helianthus annuus]|nr:hypothetical protein HanPI659440_Chr13g0507671 [Helianthus annuus]
MTIKAYFEHMHCVIPLKRCINTIFASITNRIEVRTFPHICFSRKLQRFIRPGPVKTVCTIIQKRGCLTLDDLTSNHNPPFSIWTHPSR